MYVLMVGLPRRVAEMSNTVRSIVPPCGRQRLVQISDISTVVWLNTRHPNQLVKVLDLLEVHVATKHAFSMEDKRRDPQKKIFTGRLRLRRGGGDFHVQMYFFPSRVSPGQGCRDAFCQSDGRAQTVA